MLRLWDREGVQDLDGIGHIGEEDEMRKGTAEEVLKVIEGLKAESNIRRVIQVDEFGWSVIIEHKCYDAYTKKDWWKEVASQTSGTFIEALDFAVIQGS